MLFPSLEQCPNMDSDDFYVRVEYLYASIQSQHPVAQPVLSAIILPSGRDIIECSFDMCIHEVARQINTRMCCTYVSVRYEGRKHWSLLGSRDADCLEFQIIRNSRNHTNVLKVTRHLMGASFVQCALRGDTTKLIMKDLCMAMRTVSGKDIIPNNEI